MSIGDWLEERAGFKKFLKYKLNLLIPNTVPVFYCFGGISLTIIILQLLTGISMLFFYIPKPEDAFNSILRLSNEIPLGWLMRNMHRWGATILIATLITHMANVFYHRAFQRPRELNWLSGFTMLFVIMLFSITGSILPWNWRAYWLLTIWVDYIGTWPVVGEALKLPMLKYFTVGRSFVIHILLLPILSVILLTFHFKMVKRHGISGPF